MRKNIIWFVMAIASLITACKSETLHTDDFVVTPVPTQQPLTNRPEITNELTEVMREAGRWGLENEVYKEINLDTKTVSFLKLYFVSAGVFDTAEVMLNSGETLQADIVYAYQLNHAQQVIVVPIVIGTQMADGEYTYYADTYEGPSPSRDIAQPDAEVRLTAGTVFTLMARDADECYDITRNSLVWDESPEINCQAGAQLDRGYIQLMVMQGATQLPGDWMMMGWYFTEMPDLGILDL